MYPPALNSLVPMGNPWPQAQSQHLHHPMLLISMLVPLPLLETITRLSSRLQNPFRLMAKLEPMTAASLQGDDVAGRQKNRMKAIDCLLHEVPWTKTRAEGLQQNFRTTAAQVE